MKQIFKNLSFMGMLFISFSLSVYCSENLSEKLLCLAPQSTIPTLENIFDISYFENLIHELQSKESPGEIAEYERVIIAEIYQRTFNILRHIRGSDQEKNIKTRMKKFIQWFKEPQVRPLLTQYLDVRISMLEKVFFGNDILETQSNSLVGMSEYHSDFISSSAEFLEKQSKILSRMKGEKMSTTVMSSGFSISHTNKNVGYVFSDFIRNQQGEFLESILGEKPTVMLVNNKWVVIGMDNKWSVPQDWLGGKSLLEVIYVDGWSEVKRNLDIKWKDLLLKTENKEEAEKILRSIIKDSFPAIFLEGESIDILVDIVTDTKDGWLIARDRKSSLFQFLEKNKYSLVERLKDHLKPSLSNQESMPAQAVEAMQWRTKGLAYLEEFGNKVSFNVASREYNNLYARLNRAIRLGGRTDLKDKEMMDKVDYIHSLIIKDQNTLNMVKYSLSDQESYRSYQHISETFSAELKDQYSISYQEWQRILPLIQKRQARNIFNEELEKEIAENNETIDTIENFLKSKGLKKDITEDDVEFMDIEKVDFNHIEVINNIRRRDYIYGVNQNLKSMRFEDEISSEGKIHNQEWDNLMESGESRFDMFLKFAAYKKSVEVINFLFDRFEGENSGKEFFYYDMKDMGFIPLMPFTADYYYRPEKNRFNLQKIAGKNNYESFVKTLDEYSAESIWNRRDKKFIEKWAFPVCASIHANFFNTFFKGRHFKPYNAETQNDVKNNLLAIPATIDGDEHRLAFSYNGKVYNLSFDFDNFQAGDIQLRKLGILGDRDALFFNMHERILKTIEDFIHKKEKEAALLESIGDVASPGIFTLQELGDYIINQVPEEVKLDLNPDRRTDKKFLLGISKYLNNLQKDPQIDDKSQLIIKENLNKVQRSINDSSVVFEAQLPINIFRFQGRTKRDQGDQSRLLTGKSACIGITGAGSVIEITQGKKTLSPHDYQREYEKNDHLTENMKFFGKKGDFMTKMTNEQKLLMEKTIDFNEKRKTFYMEYTEKLKAINPDLNDYSEEKLKEVLELILLSDLSFISGIDNQNSLISEKMLAIHLSHIKINHKSILNAIGGKVKVRELAEVIKNEFLLTFHQNQRDILASSLKETSKAA